MKSWDIGNNRELEQRITCAGLFSYYLMHIHPVGILLLTILVDLSEIDNNKMKYTYEYD